MRRPFVLRVQADDPAAARAVARALVEPLRERGARVLLDGEPQGGPGKFGVHVLTGDRALRGVALRIGVWDDDKGARWLAPLEIPPEPAGAVTMAMSFLESWGFVAAPPARAVRAPSHT
ncbi:MAG TPA: hypothetical protein VFH78_12570 [Candidatus Thermoplasmatota archaeon]|nr:hypothetical protein [Candidatus Thermoplasmatota archaeon]